MTDRKGKCGHFYFGENRTSVLCADTLREAQCQCPVAGSDVGWMSSLRGREPQVARFMPAVDVSEDDAKYCITVELPGASKDDVTVEHHDNMLTIRGEKKSEREEKKEQRRYVERTFGSFSRSFSLPADADADQVKATFENGVLTLAIPKTEADKPRVVAIK